MKDQNKIRLNEKRRRILNKQIFKRRQKKEVKVIEEYVKKEDFDRLIEDSLKYQEYQLEYDDIEDKEIDYPED